MININLLPEELAPNKKALNISKKIFKVMIVWLVILIVGAGSAFAYTLNLKSKINNSIDNQEQLKNSIKALQETEQRLILIKDRLDKINLILNEKNSWEDLGNVKNIIEENSIEVNYQSSSIDPGSVEIGVVTADSLTLKLFLNDLIERSSYEKISIDTLEFTRGKGYGINFNLME